MLSQLGDHQNSYLIYHLPIIQTEMSVVKYIFNKLYNLLFCYTHILNLLCQIQQTNNVHVTVDWITNIAMKHCRHCGHCQNINCSILSNNVSTRMMMIMFIIVILFSSESMVTAGRIFGETELNPGV